MLAAAVVGPRGPDAALDALLGLGPDAERTLPARPGECRAAADEPGLGKRPLALGVVLAKEIARRLQPVAGAGPHVGDRGEVRLEGGNGRCHGFRRPGFSL